MITEITPEQRQQVYAARERWRAIGTSTDAADRETTERIVAKWYEVIGRDEPQFRWFGGPWSCLKAMDVPSLGASLRAPLRAELHNRLGALLYAQVGVQVGAQLCAQLRAELYDKLFAQFRVQIFSHLRSELNAYAALHHHPMADDVPESAYFATCRDVFGIEYVSDAAALLRDWEQLAQAAGWFFPFEDVCLCAERPAALHFDVDYRLHCETGPAILCRDGFAVHAWHGTRVPPEWIERPDELDPATALTWPHAEQRTAAAQIIGWDRVLKQLDPVVVDRDPNPMFGELLRVDLPDAPGSQFLRARCGTGRVIVVPVPDTARTAVEAGALTYGLTAELYRQLEIRT